jgi:hypothetical protein
MFLYIERQFNHPLQQIIGRDAFEIFEYQFFGKQAGDIANLQSLVSGCKHKIAVTVVDYNHVFLFVIP